MRRVTRASSRAGAEISNNNDNNNNNNNNNKNNNDGKCDMKTPKSEVHGAMDENNLAVASKLQDGLIKEESQNSKNNVGSKATKVVAKRQPLGDIALNAVDDDVKKRETRTRGDRGSDGSKVDAEVAEYSPVVASEISVDEKSVITERVENEELAATEFMGPSILDVVQEVDEDAGEGDKGVRETYYKENVVESSGAELTVSNAMDSTSGSLRTKATNSEENDQLCVRKSEIDISTGMNDPATLQVEYTNSSDGGLSNIVRTSPLAKYSMHSSPKPNKRPEDPIEEMDAMAAAIEELGEALPSLNLHISPAKLNKSSVETAAANRPKVSKTPQGRPSIAKRTDPTIARNNSVSRTTSQSTRRAPARLSNTSVQHSNKRTNRSCSSMSGIADTNRSSSSSTAKTIDYLASRRPSINMKFPTPPSAPKNIKPHVVPEFKLPSDALAAKFRAQREERLRKEQEEEAARREFKARPVPRSLSASINGVTAGPRPTAATTARENLMREAKADITPVEKDKQSQQSQQSKRKSGLTDVGSTAKSLDKRRSAIIATAQHEKRTAPRVSSIMPLQSQTASRRNSTTVPNSSISGSANKATIAVISDAATLRAKGREVFNRDRLAKEEMDRERRAKEEAARKARAEAAERGRQTSREWAEKQKQKMLAEKIKARVEAAKCA